MFGDRIEIITTIIDGEQLHFTHDVILGNSINEELLKKIERKNVAIPRLRKLRYSAKCGKPVLDTKFLFYGLSFGLVTCSNADLLCSKYLSNFLSFIYFFCCT